ncbi:hypothetical protein RJ639_023363 [Escallonia herrerae]|uniref:Uncharacterized protein n=1 Tax=Escallonia herrerae TaxID=1293975 RepID=A0AA88V105_9ASTE|nr:hypothetical protein RJ639_023363 [Escallonia herrerae]
MMCSGCAVFVHLIAAEVMDAHTVHRHLTLASLLILIAVVAMVLAFITGIFAVLAHALALAIFWKARVENQTGKKLKYIRSDNGLEYKDEEFLLWDPVAKKRVISRDVVFNEAHMLNWDAASSKRQGHTVEIKLHEQRIKSADESRDGYADEQSLEDPEEHSSDSWNLVKDREPRSTNYGIMFDCDGAKGESTTALSTTEAECMALTEAAKEALWLKGLVEELGFKQRDVLLQCDSQSTTNLAKNQVFHARTKRIDVHYHRVREWIISRQIVEHKVHTNDNATDMLTKTVTTEKFEHCLSLIHLLSC